MFEFYINDKKYTNIHFIGIGGISMSGLAEILLSEKYTVSGSDSKNGPTTDRLEKLGAKIYIGHSEKNINEDIDLVIYTDAISKDNVELNEALNRKIKTVDRATFLGSLIRNYKNSIAVSGTHGKTSTTSMLSSILNRPELDPTILLGGNLDEIGGNVKIGNKNYLLTEACEYKGNVLKYHPSIAIILNIEEDHMDFFKDIDHIVDTFIGYTKNIQKNGHLVINLDDPHAEKIIANTEANIVTFAIDKPADYQAKNIRFNDEGFPVFDLYIKGDNTQTISLSLLGYHNIYNTLASIATSHTLGLAIEDIIKAVENYKGTHRRLEYKGNINDIVFMDDYAHHPTEIKVTLNALKKSDRRVICIFQPHTYTRTKILLNEFSKAFSEVDKLIITDIFAAREKDNGEIHSLDLVNSIKNNNVDVTYIKEFHDIEEYILSHAENGDTVVTMGAGDVYLIGENILNSSQVAIV